MRLNSKEIFLIISLSLIFLYGLIYFLYPDLRDNFEAINLSLENFAKRYGYFGAFLVSLIGSATILIVIPYPAIIFLLANLGLNPLLLALVAGMAAALGEFIGYLIGLGGRKIVNTNDRKKFDQLQAWMLKHPKLTPLIIFIFGITPLPDDIVFIPLGLLKYGFKKAFIPNFLGKMIMLLGVSYLGRFSLDYLNLGLTGEGGFIGQIVTLVLTVMTIYIILKIDWEKLIKRNV